MEAEEKEKKEKEEKEKDEDEDSLGKQEEDFKNIEFLRMKISEQNVVNLMKVGHQFEDFVVYCTFRGVYCA